MSLKRLGQWKRRTRRRRRRRRRRTWTKRTMVRTQPHGNAKTAASKKAGGLPPMRHILHRSS
eukprot:5391975-Karenia_brevis.AAC.1